VNRLGFFCCLAVLTAANRPDRDQRFFDTRVASILTKRCLACHNEQLKNGNISFLDRDSLLKVITPGNPEASKLIDTLRHDGDVQMPPGPKLPPREIAILTEWIKRGAVWGTKLRAKK
jgi:hypothetical protein